MGAIADSIMSYAQPLIDTTDDSLEQLNNALAISQACWNLAILPEPERQSTLEKLRSAVGMGESEFADLELSVISMMIRRHEEMFPGLHKGGRGPSAHPEFTQSKNSGGPDQLIRELDAAYDHLPEGTLRACQQQREQMVPRLIDVLQEAARLGGDGVVREGNAPIYALLLLGEFQATEALPALCSLLNAPAHVSDRLLNDSITEDLARVLATLAANQLDALDAIIDNSQANEFVRWSTAEALTYLVRDRSIERQHAVERLRGHLRTAISTDDYQAAMFLVYVLLDLNGFEARAEIDDAFAKDLVDQTDIDLDSVNEALRPDEPDLMPRLERLGPTKIGDVVEEMRTWHWETKEEIARREWSDLPLADDEWPEESDSGDFDDGDSYPHSPDTIRRETPRVGRNDPCPCGSGKKYKKCCLRAFQE